MRRRLILIAILLCVVASVALGILSVGYLAHREKIKPIFGLGERIIVRGRRDLGLPTETHGMVERIETTYLTLQGKVYLMPDQEFRTGGALALWDDDVIVQHSRGTILVLDDEKGLMNTDIAVPENGLEAYIRLAAEKYPDQIAKDYAIRYNDLEYVDSRAFRGFLSSYTFIDVKNECYRSRISKLDIPRSVTSVYDLTASASDWEIIYDSNPCLEFNDTRELLLGYMAGGRLAFKEPDIVYLGNGEYHRGGFYRPDAGIQSDDSDYGKTIEINMTTGQSRHYSKGHRNLQGVALDMQGRLWTTEHGMRGGDELNLIVDQENYGWPLENLGTLYSGIPAQTEGRVGRHEIYRTPVYAWLPSVAVSSLALVEDFHEAWDGDLLIGSLRERALFRARIQDDRIVFLETIPIGQRIRDVMQVGPEKLALWLDTEEVVILTIEQRSDPLADLVVRLTEKGMATDIAGTARDVLAGCNQCHSYDENVHGAGPSLHNLAGRRIASTAFANYSTALRGISGVWDVQSLTAYLTDPEAFAPGTAMAGLGVGNPEIASAVAAAFKELYAPVEYE